MSLCTIPRGQKAEVERAQVTSSAIINRGIWLRPNIYLGELQLLFSFIFTNSVILEDIIIAIMTAQPEVPTLELNDGNSIPIVSHLLYRGCYSQISTVPPSLPLHIPSFH